MSGNSTNMYDLDAHVAEIYDQTDTCLDDVELLLRFLAALGPLRILEPFCGTGRVLIPLALHGHTVVGLDQAGGMLNRARAKVSRLAEDVRQRITLEQCDVTTCEWPCGFDAVILGGNCFYELATPVEQEECIASAAVALRAGGHLFVDNDHMEGDLDASWQQTGVSSGFPTGVCGDGVRVEGSGEAIWWDVGQRVIRFRRQTKVILPDGRVLRHEFLQQKHPPSATEVRGWLERHAFLIKGSYGDYSGAPYGPSSARAIFWAQKPSQPESGASGTRSRGAV